MSIRKNIAKFSRGLLYLLICFIGLSFLLIVGYFIIESAHETNTLSFFIKSHHISFMVWRYIAMATVIYFYPHFLRQRYSKRSDIDQEKLKTLCQRRWIVLAFAIYELLIVHNILSPLFNWFLGF